MAKILFVTTRNICNMCGEYRLIVNRSCVLKDKFGINTDFYALVSESKLKKKREPLDSECVNIISYKMNPLDILLKYRTFVKIVMKALEKERYDAVVLSGAFPFNIAKSIRKKSNIRIVYDSHAAWEELTEFNPSLTKKIKFRLFTCVEKNILNYTDILLAVSRELTKYLDERYGYNRRTFVVPCAPVLKNYSADEAAQLRKKWRAELNVADDETLFVYSGGNSPWQSIDDAYEVYLKYVSEGFKAKFLVMTPDSDKLKYENAIIKSFPAEKVSEVLFAGDVAMLLRGDFITNHVAFPNKYLEYVMSGMLIVSTPYLRDISKEISEEAIGIIVHHKSELLSSDISMALENRKSFENIFNHRKTIMEKHRFENTLMLFADEIKALQEEKN